MRRGHIRRRALVVPRRPLRDRPAEAPATASTCPCSGRTRRGPRSSPAQSNASSFGTALVGLLRLQPRALTRLVESYVRLRAAMRRQSLGMADRPEVPHRDAGAVATLACASVLSPDWALFSLSITRATVP